MNNILVYLNQRKKEISKQFVAFDYQHHEQQAKLSLLDEIIDYIQVNTMFSNVNQDTECFFDFNIPETFNSEALLLTWLEEKMKEADNMAEYYSKSSKVEDIEANSYYSGIGEGIELAIGAIKSLNNQIELENADTTEDKYIG